MPATALADARATRNARGGGAYDYLAQHALDDAGERHTEGWSYLISGRIAVGVSIPGYYLSNDLFARTAYSLGQTLGIAAVGYGSYLVLIDNDMERFRQVIRAVPDLSLAQKNRLARAYFLESAREARNARRIRVITHSLTAALNFANAATTSYQELQTALYFIGGINLLAALGYGLSRSAEETFADTLADGDLPGAVAPPGWQLTAAPAAAGGGAGLGLTFRF